MPDRRAHTIPDTTRSRIVLEVASELTGTSEWPYRQARVTLREQGADRWKICFFGSDTPAAIEEVARGDTDIAIINPANPLVMAVQGTGPYKKPIPLRVITVIPTYDQFVFAVTKKTGLNSLSDIRERRYPLKVSLRGQPDHSNHMMVRETLAAVGFTLDDIVSWGGTVSYDDGLPNRGPHRIAAVERGEIDAVFDEAVNTWVHLALDLDMRLLPIEEPTMQKLEKMGLRHSLIPKATYPKLPEDVLSVDFSGWPIFTHERVADEIITPFCAALEARKDRIPWWGGGPLPLERMCRDTPETPVNIPFHPAAERFWRERGYLS